MLGLSGRVQATWDDNGTCWLAFLGRKSLNSYDERGATSRQFPCMKEELLEWRSAEGKCCLGPRDSAVWITMWPRGMEVRVEIDDEGAEVLLDGSGPITSA